MLMNGCIDIHEIFYADHPRGTPPSGELNTRGVALAQWAFYKKGLSA